MFEYKVVYDNPKTAGKTFPEVVITLDEDATLDDQLEAFATFLRAVGYVFEGKLNVFDVDAAIEDSWDEERELDEPVVE